MIRFYCQYSFGGFRTFRIFGQENEILANQEVNRDNTLDFPPQCTLYFNFGGAKLLMRALDDGQIAIVLRDIPGIEKDTDGRAINCALQIVGDPDDLPVMRNAMLAIINDVPAFQTNFTDGFSLRGGLHYDGRFLDSFIKNLVGKTLAAPDTVLGNFDERTGPVYLFVPTSPLFGEDVNLTSKVIKELQLASSKEEISEVLQNTISESVLETLAGHVVEISDPAIPAATKDSDHPDKNGDAPSDLPPAANAKKPNDRDNENNSASESLRIIDLERDLQTADKEKAELENLKDELKQKIEELLEANRKKRKTILGITIGASVITLALIISLILK